MTEFFAGVAETQNVATSYTNNAQPAQAPVAATPTIITGSTIVIPGDGLKVGAIYQCDFNATKTAAGTATGTLYVGVTALGVAVTAANLVTGVLASFTKAAGTAAADNANFTLWLKVLAIGAAEAGSVVASLQIVNALTATGFTSGDGKSMWFADTTTATVTTPDAMAGGTIGAVITTGASDAYTINAVRASLTQ